MACPNCTTIVTVMPLKPLHDAGRLRRVVATSYQAVSGAGVKGIEELRERDAGVGARRGHHAEVIFAHQIAFNLIPAIDTFGDDGYTGEEMKLVNEIAEDPRGARSAGLADDGAGAGLHLPTRGASTSETEDKITASRARDLFARFPGAACVGRAG